MANKRVVAPTSIPLTVDQIKDHINEDATDRDEYIEGLIRAAAGLCESGTVRSLMLQTRAETLDAFPDGTSPYDGMIKLTFPPVVSIDSVVYLDPEGAPQTLAPSSYTLDNASDVAPGWLAIAPGYQWPQTYPRINAVTVRYVAGHALAADVPEELQQWMKLIIGHWYANREAVNVGNITGKYDYVESLLDGYRIY